MMVWGLPSLKLTAKEPARRPSQKETIVLQPSICMCCYISFRQGKFACILDSLIELHTYKAIHLGSIHPGCLWKWKIYRDTRIQKKSNAPGVTGILDGVALPETNSWPLKINGWKMNFLLGPGLFSGANC